MWWYVIVLNGMALFRKLTTGSWRFINRDYIVHIYTWPQSRIGSELWQFYSGETAKIKWHMIIFFYQSVKHPCHHTISTFSDPLWRREEHAHEVVCFHQGSHPSWVTCRPSLGDSTPQFWHSGRGSHPCLGSRPSFGPKHAQWGSCLVSEMASPWLHILLCQKSCRITRCVGRGIVLDIHKASSQNARRPRTHTTEKPDVTLQLRVPSSTTSSLLPPWYWGVTVSVHGLDARIYQFLPLPAAHTSTTISIKPCEARLITEDTVPPGSEVPHSVRSPQHMAASPVIQSQCVTPGGTLRSTARNLFTMLRIRRIISTCIRGAEMKWLSLTVQINCLVFSGFAQNLPTSTPPLMWPTTVSVALQTFADTSLQHTQHSCDFSLRKALSRQSYNMHHYLLFPNCTAWCHQRSMKKCKML